MFLRDVGETWLMDVVRDDEEGVQLEVWCSDAVYQCTAAQVVWRVVGAEGH